jgi:hypothetical protein
MMRLFSSRRESITADLRGRAARFEQRYGRAPSQRELAQLAQASNFTTRNPKHGALDLAQAHAGCEQRAPVTVHQVAALARLGKTGPGQPAWAALMARMRRKTLIVCRPCHEHIHANRAANAA